MNRTATFKILLKVPFAGMTAERDNRQILELIYTVVSTGVFTVVERVGH
jgi:hypothetical protein